MLEISRGATIKNGEGSHPLTKGKTLYHPTTVETLTVVMEKRRKGNMFHSGLVENTKLQMSTVT